MIYSEIFIELGWSFQSHLKSVSYRFFKMLLVRLSVSSCELQNSAIKKASLRNIYWVSTCFPQYVLLFRVKMKYTKPRYLPQKSTQFWCPFTSANSKDTCFFQDSLLYTKTTFILRKHFLVLRQIFIFFYL